MLISVKKAVLETLSEEMYTGIQIVLTIALAFLLIFDQIGLSFVVFLLVLLLQFFQYVTEQHKGLVHFLYKIFLFVVVILLVSRYGHPFTVLFFIAAEVAVIAFVLYKTRDGRSVSTKKVFECMKVFLELVALFLFFFSVFFAPGYVLLGSVLLYLAAILNLLKIFFYKKA